MIWIFLKKRWFPLALVLLVLVALLRKNIRINLGDPLHKDATEKYTREPVAAQSTSLLGITPGSRPAVSFPGVEAAEAVAFLKRFSQVAVAEQEKFGMPASVLLGCAYVNSFAGKRDCATSANNFLAIHCSPDWGGPAITLSGSCFRKYETPWESIRDFNNHLCKNSWYVALRKSAESDWKAWAEALAGHRASDVEHFKEELTKVIETYRLDDLDD